MPKKQLVKRSVNTKQRPTFEDYPAKGAPSGIFLRKLQNLLAHDEECLEEI